MNESDELARAEQDYRAEKLNLESAEQAFTVAKGRLAVAIKKLDLPKEPST